MQGRQAGSVNANGPQRRLFGWLEVALLIAALVLAYQFLPSSYHRSILKWTAVKWKWFVGAMDIREWSLTARLLLNASFVVVLIGFRSLPTWVRSHSQRRATRKSVERIQAVSEIEKDRAIMLEHYKKMHEVEKATKS